ncbi:SpoIID/LytB domain-containing protein [Lacrimispora saccharolytica]|uniref:SpoIID/LytB domain protein n=1 Tax=Lacrimispora saccharolytica (strain ATCC 35040 / DSM 2544 / NRCC 2533 / WM1) TaxID=610130 RepID=D9R2C3_LACSW|nr:SpoIID/LytB domain-containing protein [Lacrimispora saccharolytica]ADL04773.1 SpoIID/LytB domain protein [[Clostridium] saccharolyticum WM1]QRV21009.1 SpoIID/LytB domain-containing protein [Lacrimispora saccharolytica]
MNKKTFIGFVVGIPLLVLILIIIILVNEPEPEGISRGAAYKSAALLLTDRGNCEKMLKDQKQEYFPEKEQNNWYVKYMNYLYIGGYLDPGIIPPKRETAEGFLTYQEAESLAEALVPGSGKKIHDGGKKQNTKIPAGEWWDLYEELRETLDKEGNIKELDVLLYGTPTNVKAASAWTAYTSRGNFQFEGISLDSYIDWELKLLVRNGEIIALKETVTDSITYKNVWLASGEGGTFRVYLGSVERTFPLEASLGQPEEFANNIADISLKRGNLQKVTMKKKKISGKVLAVKEDSIEVEGYGSLKLDKDFKVYRLYGQFEERSITDILVGYDIQDFVVAHGRICAALLVREFDAKSIRVLLMNTNFQSIFHSSVTLSAESGLALSYGEKVVNVPPKAEVIIDTTDERLKDGRIVAAPLEKGDSISVNSIRRSYGTPSYGGTVEIRKEGEGLLLINELYLEDYLTKVVPSEMPDSYEKEALKAQAVCARTYAFRQIQSNTYSKYGAHVDDSTRFQVYNNLPTASKTEEAVRETYGKLLFYDNNPIEAFYFSTSCGHTTDGSVWGGDPAQFPYLDGSLLQDSRGVLNLSTNSDFDEFIKKKDYPAYDSAYPMYRWETSVTNRQLEEEITEVGSILNITVTERGVGGIVKKLRIEGSDGIMTINGEGQVRAKLGNKYMTVTKLDGTMMKNFDSLPSAYIAIENQGVDDKNITTFHIYGGGFGHGVGMSQNGAQAMAKAGKNFEDILKFYYYGTEVREAEQSKE